jgi:pilus assembly protein Flp/PilA
MQKKNLTKKKKTKGQSLVEYGLILALVSVVAITVLQLMGGQIKQTVNNVTQQLDQANQAAQNSAGSS